MNPSLLALYGLKWNPFSPELPAEALRLTPAAEDFVWRVEQTLVREGGFAMIHGDPGTGKSVVLRLLAERLERIAEVSVTALNHPQSNLADFYREMGEVFGVGLKPHNRWGGFKSLRERWLAHLESVRLRPVLLIDEAQEMTPATLSELRLLSSARFDSRPLLSVVMAGDARLTEKLRRDDLLPAGQSHPRAPGHGVRQPGRPGRLPGTSALERRQRLPDDRAVARHAVRPRRRQLPDPHHDGRAVAGRRNPISGPSKSLIALTGTGADTLL
jgi:hypothetical protein